MAAEVETLRKRFEAAGQGHVFAEFDTLSEQGAVREDLLSLLTHAQCRQGGVVA